MGENFMTQDVKWIYVYQNGDLYTPPVKFVVCRKHLRNFDVFLNSLTQRLKPRFGAVRNIYTPENGGKIHSLDQLEPNHNYVAAGTEKFRKVRYGSIRGFLPVTRGHHSRQNSLIQIQPVVHSAIKVASRYKTAIKNSAALTIFVYSNGDDISPFKVVPLIRKDMRNWEVVLRRISEKLLPSSSGHVRKLYTLTGHLINRMVDLQNGEFYVATIGREVFKLLTYGMLNPPVSRKFTNWKLSDFASPCKRMKTPSNFATAINKKSLVKCQSLDKSGRVRSSLLNEREKQKGIFTVNDPTSGPSKVKEVDYDEDNSGVYRAKLKKKDNQAFEIHETEETAVELPVDARTAEEINEEEIVPLMRKTMRELSSNTANEDDLTMPANYPSMEVEVDDVGNVREIKSIDAAQVKKSIGGSDNQLTDKRSNWCNDMRKLKVRLLSKIRNTTQSVVDMSPETASTSWEAPPCSKSFDQCKTHRLTTTTVDSVQESKTKLPRITVFANKSSSSSTSELGTRHSSTYTVESCSSEGTPLRNFSSQEDVTKVDSMQILTSDLHLLDINQVSSEEQIVKERSTFNDTSSSENINFTYNNEKFAIKSNTDLVNIKNNFETILNHNLTDQKNGDDLPSVNDFPQVSTFKVNESFFGNGDELNLAAHSVLNSKLSSENMIKDANHLQVNFDIKTANCFVMETELLNPLKIMKYSQNSLVLNIDKET